jgi:hypothetical protein
VFMQMIAHLRDRAVNCSKDRSDPAERNLKSEVIPIRAVTVAKSEKSLAGVAKSLMARPMNLAIEDMNMTGPAAKQGVENIGAVSESSYRKSNLYVHSNVGCACDEPLHCVLHELDTY